MIIPKPFEEKYEEEIIIKDPLVSTEIDTKLGKEEYTLSIDENGVKIKGGSDTAVFYGKNSFIQLNELYDGEFPGTQIHDKPAFSFRSIHLDSSRHMLSVSEIKKMLTVAAHFKKNVLHWHLTDDQGWRIEMKNPDLVKLHEVGSVRAGDHFGAYSSDEEEGGYYTRDEIKEIVAYAGKLGMEVVPEIDLPGHVTAVLAGYPHLSCTGVEKKVATRGGIFEDILCAGKEEVFEFIFKVIDDVCELFPSEYFHIGGDEAPKTKWDACPLCRKRMEEQGLHNMRELQGYFMNRISRYLKSKGKTAICWNEATYGGNLDTDIIVQYWIKDDGGFLQKWIDDGGKIINSFVENCYFDYPYGAINLKMAHSLDVNYKNMIGNDCLLWAEYIRTNEYLEQHAWPRSVASAEMGWSGANVGSYEDFESRLNNLITLFDEFNVSYEPSENWVPGEEEAQRQIDEFRQNWDPKYTEQGGNS